MAFFTQYVETHPDDVGWTASYVLLIGEDNRKTAIGTCGFTARPDDTGTVETITPSCRSTSGVGMRRGRRGARGLGVGHPSVTRVIAHTFPALRQ